MSGVISDNLGRSSGLLKAASTGATTYDAEYLVLGGGGSGGQRY